jgi:DNA polymerase-3 subunit epsilon
VFNEHIVFLDLETTGGSATLDRIIEIGLIEVNRGVVVGEWSTLINPGRRIPHGIQVLTGITDDMAQSAPAFSEISAGLAERLEGKVLAAHNARFDYGFLKGEFLRAGLRYVAPVLCTVKLSRRLFPQHPRHNLDALIIRHALFCIDRHRALGDARVLWELAQIWNRDPGSDALSAACAELLTRPTVPKALPPDLFDTLPELPGVYIFHGEDDSALYVGKSANIRSRVLVHFSGDKRPGKDLKIAEAVRRVSWIETAGELGAHFEHARLVRALAPQHNVQARSESWSWLWRSDAPDIPPRLVTETEIDELPVEHLYGAFRSRSIATTALRELANAYGLCRVLLGLEAAASSGCSAVESERCRGACIGRESAISHSIRAVQALTKLRLKPWPYRGRIAVRERDPYSDRIELHVIERWRHLGTAHSEPELHELALVASDAAFDLDTYKALVRVLKSPPRNCDIVVLPVRAPAA